MIVSESLQLSELLKRAKRVVAFTGAGISTESGISDYRSKGGLWERYQPVTIQDYLAWDEKREEFWAYKFSFMEEVLKAKPNLAHEALVDLERSGKLHGIITQNIDGLHQKAGSSAEKILELHGNNQETKCLDCGDVRPWEETRKKLQRGEKVPRCSACKGLIKPNIVMFGEWLDEMVLARAQAWLGECDLLVVIGSTLVVEPAASLPRIAKDSGARLVIITLSSTPLDRLADLKIERKAGDVFREVMPLMVR